MPIIIEDQRRVTISSLTHLLDIDTHIYIYMNSIIPYFCFCMHAAYMLLFDVRMSQSTSYRMHAASLFLSFHIHNRTQIANDIAH